MKATFLKPLDALIGVSTLDAKSLVVRNAKMARRAVWNPRLRKNREGLLLLCIHQRCAEPQQGNQKESGFHVCLLAQMTSCCAILYRAQTLPCFRCNLYLCRCSTIIDPHGPFP